MKARLVLPNHTEIQVTITKEELERIRVPETGRFVPAPGQQYWCINAFNNIERYNNDQHGLDIARIEVGNAYESEAAAKHALAVQKARVRLEDSAKGFRPDWANLGQNKYYIWYNHKKKELEVGVSGSVQHTGLFYYRTNADAEAAIQNHREDFLLVMGIGE